MANGNMNGMIVTIDKSGRVVIPKALRERLGTALELVERPEGILLRSAQHEPAMKKVNGFWVHQGKAPANFNWDRVVDDAREERIQSIINAGTQE